MSFSGLALGNQNNWQSFYTSTTQAVFTSTTSYTPIPTVTIPVLLESHIIAVTVSCSNAKPTWNFGGYLNQRVNLGLIVGGLPDSDAVQKRKLWLNRLTLLIFPELTSTYAISFDVPKWFQDFTVTVFEYIGPSSTTDDLINSLQQTVNAIQTKVNTL